MMRCISGCLVALTVNFGASAQQVNAPLAEVGLQSRIEALSSQSDAHGFELGMLITLRGIEKTLQTRYEFGLGGPMRELPILRLELAPRNPQPKQAQPDTLTKMMLTALTDLQNARAVLKDAADAGRVMPFDLTVQDVWFDVNSNGSREANEGVVDALGPLLLGRRAMQQVEATGALEGPITVRFDEADHAWLTAYTHMLSGMGNLFVAFDPAPIIENLANRRERLSQVPIVPNTYDKDALMLEIAALNAEKRRVDRSVTRQNERLQQLRAREQALRAATPQDDAEIRALTAERAKIETEVVVPLRQEQRFLQAEISAANAKLNNPKRGFEDKWVQQADSLYVLLSALRQQPKAERVAAARDHWRAMLVENRHFWTLLQEEQDNDREWIPNPSQSSALGIAVNQQTADAWQAILDDAEALLDGRLLLPHPLLPEGVGISLKAYAENPGPLDLLDWVHGIGAYEYAAKGPMISRQRWLAFNRLTGGNAGGFALFFN